MKKKLKAIWRIINSDEFYCVTREGEKGAETGRCSWHLFKVVEHLIDERLWQ